MSLTVEIIDQVKQAEIPILEQACAACGAELVRDFQRNQWLLKSVAPSSGFTFAYLRETNQPETLSVTSMSEVKEVFGGIINRIVQTFQRGIIQNHVEQNLGGFIEEEYESDGDIVLRLNVNV